MTLEEFKKRVQLNIEQELDVFRPQMNDEQVKSFNLGVFPWYGYFELSFLTTAEANSNADDFQFDIASWKHCNFNKFNDNTHKPIHSLGLWMQAEFEKRDDGGLHFLELCADILRQKSTREKLKKYNLADDFSLTVYNADDPRNINYLSGEDAQIRRAKKSSFWDFFRRRDREESTVTWYYTEEVESNAQRSGSDAKAFDGFIGVELYHIVFQIPSAWKVLEHSPKDGIKNFMNLESGDGTIKLTIHTEKIPPELYDERTSEQNIFGQDYEGYQDARIPFLERNTWMKIYPSNDEQASMLVATVGAESGGNRYSINYAFELSHPEPYIKENIATFSTICNELMLWS